jgi:archaellum component FlaC
MRSKNLVTLVVAFIMASSMLACARNASNVASSSVSRATNGDFSSTTKSIGAQAQSNINTANEETGSLSVSSGAANNVNATNVRSSDFGSMTKSIGGQAQSNINAANEEMGSSSVSSGAANNVDATNEGHSSMTKSIGAQNNQAESNINTTNEEMPSSSISNGGFGSMTKSIGGQAQSNINTANVETASLSVSSRAANNVNATNEGHSSMTKSLGGQAQSNINAANVASLSLSSRAANNINATNVRSSDFGSMTKSIGGQNKQVQSNAANEETSDQAPCQIRTPIILTTSNQKIRGFVLEDDEDEHCMAEPDLASTANPSQNLFGKEIILITQ